MLNVFNVLFVKIIWRNHSTDYTVPESRVQNKHCSTIFRIFSVQPIVGLPLSDKETQPITAWRDFCFILESGFMHRSKICSILNMQNCVFVLRVLFLKFHVHMRLVLTGYVQSFLGRSVELWAILYRPYSRVAI